MSAQRVAILVWRDAKTEQPPDYLPVLTDRGLAFRYESEGEVNWTGEISGSELSEEPKLWAKLPKPPADDPLTLDDLWLILPAAQDTAGLLRDIDDPDAKDYAAALPSLRNKRTPSRLPANQFVSAPTRAA